MGFLKRQVYELCTRYGKIHGFWWDANILGRRDPRLERHRPVVREEVPVAVERPVIDRPREPVIAWRPLPGDCGEWLGAIRAGAAISAGSVGLSSRMKTRMNDRRTAGFMLAPWSAGNVLILASSVHRET